MKQLTKIHDLNFDQLKNRMQSVVHKLDSLVTRVTEKTELAMFLTQVCTNFRYEITEILSTRSLNRKYPHR